MQAITSPMLTSALQLKTFLSATKLLDFRRVCPEYHVVYVCFMNKPLFACRCTIALNVGLMVLFLSLAITFFLLAAGQQNTKCLKVRLQCQQAPQCMFRCGEFLMSRPCGALNSLSCHPICTLAGSHLLLFHEHLSCSAWSSTSCNVLVMLVLMTALGLLHPYCRPHCIFGFVQGFLPSCYNAPYVLCPYFTFLGKKMEGTVSGSLCLMQAAGYFGVFTSAAAWYVAFAELLNETWFRGRVSHPVSNAPVCVLLGTTIWLSLLCCEPCLTHCALKQHLQLSDALCFFASALSDLHSASPSIAVCMQN